MKGYLLMYEAFRTRLGCTVIRSVTIKDGKSVEHIELYCEPDPEKLNSLPLNPHRETKE